MQTYKHALPLLLNVAHSDKVTVEVSSWCFFYPRTSLSYYLSLVPSWVFQKKGKEEKKERISERQERGRGVWEWMGRCIINIYNSRKSVASLLSAIEPDRQLKQHEWQINREKNTGKVGGGCVWKGGKVENSRWMLFVFSNTLQRGRVGVNLMWEMEQRFQTKCMFWEIEIQEHIFSRRI